MAWNAVNELVRADYSWSGYERNVFFINNHDGTFSDVSGVLGLDLRDDCRAYALSDFDHDGRMEFVLKNRTGPQLRIFRNDLAQIGSSVALRLTGHTSNRDAIGAIVTVESEGTAKPNLFPRVPGLHRNTPKNCFLALARRQKRFLFLSFGLTARQKCLPTFRSIIAWKLRRAKGFKGHAVSADSIDPAKPAKPLHGISSAPPTVSTWLISPLFAPDVKLPDLTGTIHQVSEMRGRPILLSFFRMDCEGSQKQIGQLQKDLAELSAAGLATLAVAVNGGPDRAAIGQFAKSFGITIPILLADERTLGAWNIQFRYLFDRRRDMSFPISFIFDQSGAVGPSQTIKVGPKKVSGTVTITP